MAEKKELSRQVLGRIRGEFANYEAGGVAQQVIESLLKVKAKGLGVSAKELKAALEALPVRVGGKVLAERRERIDKVKAEVDTLCSLVNEALSAGDESPVMAQFKVMQELSAGYCFMVKNEAGTFSRLSYGWELATGRKPQYDVRPIPTPRTEGKHLNK